MNHDKMAGALGALNSVLTRNLKQPGLYKPMPGHFYDYMEKLCAVMERSTKRSQERYMNEQLRLRLEREGYFDD